MRRGARCWRGWGLALAMVALAALWLGWSGHVRGQASCTPDEDVNVGHAIDISDVAAIGRLWRQTLDYAGQHRADCNRDAWVDISDVAAVGPRWMETWEGPPESDCVPCRWPDGGGVILLRYRWAANLAPGTPWRDAFEAALGDWNAAPTRFVFVPEDQSHVHPLMLALYDPADPNIGDALGYAEPVCVGSTTVAFAVMANESLPGYPYTANRRRGIAGHELGHGGHSVAHLAWFSGPHGLMERDAGARLNSIYTPQGRDAAFINEVYPDPYRLGGDGASEGGTP